MTEKSYGPSHLWRSVSRWTQRILIALVASSVVGYLADWALYDLRGKPTGEVTVSRYLSVPLKGNKTEYDYEGSQNVACAQALFPQNAQSPCWYLSRHSIQNDKI